MKFVLDLGCGSGESTRKLGLRFEDRCVVGIDISIAHLGEANEEHKGDSWRWVCGRGETLPFRAESFDGVLSNVALPYMHIPRVLGELHRVLVPGARVRMALHPPDFAWSELRRAVPRPQQSLYRVYVLVNGLILHLSGRAVPLGRICESCQTERGMRIALRRAGFTDVTFSRVGARFFLEARRDWAWERRSKLAAA